MLVHPVDQKPDEKYEANHQATSHQNNERHSTANTACAAAPVGQKVGNPIYGF